MRKESTVILREVLPTKEFKSVQRKNQELVLEILKKEADYFLDKNFDMKLEIPLTLNSRLRSTYGRFRYYRESLQPINIDIQTAFATACIVTNKIDILLDVLRHELVHYALFSKGIPNSDGDVEFENKLKELNVGASMATATAKIKSFITKQVDIENMYECNDCGDKGAVESSKKRIICRCHSKKCKGQFKDHTKTDDVSIKILKYDIV